MTQVKDRSKEVVCEVIFATVAEDASGIHLRLRDEDQKIHVTFIPKEVWGKVPSNKNPKKELQIIADLLNGFKISLDGNSKEKIPDFQPKKIRLVIE